MPTYDDNLAMIVRDFIERYCTHVKGHLARKPIILEDWQKNDIINPIFGTVNDSTGFRQYNRVYVEIPRKNAKTTLISTLGLYLTGCDNELGAEVYAAAGSRDQAGLIFEPSKAMINQSKSLGKVFRVYRRNIYHKSTNSIFQVVSADHKRQHGYNAHGVLFDELHVQPNPELYNVLDTATGARLNSLFISLTTAGLVETFAEEMHDYAVNVKNGTIDDPHFFPIIYAADPDDDPFDPATWAKANPGLGTIVQMDYFLRQVRRAKNEKAFLNTFRQLHLNIWVQSAEAWITDAEVQACNQKKYVIPKGAICFGGLDLATRRDLTALVLLFPMRAEGQFFQDFEASDTEAVQKFVSVAYHFIPEETVVKKSKNEHYLFRAWVDEGHITATSGNVTDYDYIIDRVHEVANDYQLRSLAYDRWGSAPLIQQLTTEGIAVDTYGQGYKSMSEPTKILDAWVGEKKIELNKNPLMRWQFSNVVLARSPAGDVKPTKDKSKNKIDGVVSLVMCVGTYLTHVKELIEASGKKFTFSGDLKFI